MSSTPLQSNTDGLQYILNVVNALPSAGGDNTQVDKLIERSISGSYENDTVASVGEYAFHGCKSLTALVLPEATSIGQYAFRNCSALVSVSAQKVESIGQYAFYGCSALTKADFSASSIASYAFRNSKLDALILRASVVCSLSNANAFLDTPIKSGTGYIYVPAALVDSYKAATNWTTYANQIRAIENYPDICGGTA